jgi:hypothetical protein
LAACRVSATATLATLDLHNLVLELPKHTQANLAAARDGTRESEAALLAAHELTRWYDIIGTTWRQAYSTSCSRRSTAI